MEANRPKLRLGTTKSRRSRRVIALDAATVTVLRDHKARQSRRAWDEVRARAALGGVSSAVRVDQRRWHRLLCDGPREDERETGTAQALGSPVCHRPSGAQAEVGDFLALDDDGVTGEGLVFDQLATDSQLMRGGAGGPEHVKHPLRTRVAEAFFHIFVLFRTLEPAYPLLRYLPTNCRKPDHAERSAHHGIDEAGQ